MLAILLFSVSATKDFDILSASPIDLGNVAVDLSNSQNVNADIELNNTGNESIKVRLLLGELTNGNSNITVPETTENLVFNESKNLSFNLNIASNQEEGTYTGIVILAQDGNNSNNETVALTLVVNSTLAVSDSEPLAPYGVQGGSDVIANWTLTNTGNDEITSLIFSQSSTLELTTDSSETISFVDITTPTTIAYGATGLAEFRATIVSSTVPGIYQGTVNYTSNGGSNERTVQIEVKSNAASISHETSLSMSAVNNQNSIQKKINVSNTAWVSDTVGIAAFTVNDGNESLTISATPSSQAIAAQDKGEFTLAFNPSGKAAGTYTGTANVTYGTNNQTTIDVTVTITDPVSSISFGNLEIGDSTQVRNVTVSGSFTITNNGDTTVSNIQLTQSIDSKYSFSLSSTPSSLASGATDTVNYQITIPENQRSARVEVGSIAFTSDKVNQTSKIYLTTKSELIVKKVEVKLEGEDYDRICEENEYSCDSYDIEPDKKLTFKITLKNLHTDQDIEKTEFEVTIRDIDDEGTDDLSKKSDRFTIREEDDDYETVVFNLPDKLPDSESFEVEITAEGELEDGPDVSLPETIRFTLTYDRENEDVRIMDSYFTQDPLTCDRTTALKVKIANFGSEGVDEARIVVYSDQLDYLNREHDEIDLSSDPFDSDNDYTATYSITVPENYNGNKVDFTVWAFHGDSDSDYENYDDHVEEMTLTLAPCGGTNDATTRRQTTTTTQSSVVTFIGGGDTTGQYDYLFDSSEVPFTETSTYVALLVLINIIVIGGVIILIIKALA